MNKILATSIVLVSLSGTLQAATTSTGSENINSIPKVAPQQVMKKTWLGVSLAPVPKALSKQLAKVIPEKQGVMTHSVVPNSPASKAGLQDFDILLSFNNSMSDQQLYSAEQLVGLIASSKVGDEVVFSIIRNGRKEDIKVKLAERELVSHQSRMPNPMFDGLNNGMRANHGLQPFIQPNFGQFFRPQAGFPKMPSLPKGSEQANVMQKFESISINSLSDDRFRAKVVYQENGGEKKEFTFEGKYDEIRKQIADSKELPEDKKNSLLNALKNNPNQLMPDGLMSFPQMPAFPAMPSFDRFFKQQPQAPSWFSNGSKL